MELEKNSPQMASFLCVNVPRPFECSWNGTTSDIQQGIEPLYISTKIEKSDPGRSHQKEES